MYGMNSLKMQFFSRGIARNLHPHKEANKLEPGTHVLEDATSSNNRP